VIRECHSVGCARAGIWSRSRTAQIALDAEETRAVAASCGLELTPGSAETLRKRTEGWAAAVVLTALSLRGREDASERAASLSGDQEHVADYLLEEVLKNQTDQLTMFLLGTSILDPMNAPLCNPVLQVENSADSLEALARSNAFVIPLDDRREWYRYHHLFGDLRLIHFLPTHLSLQEIADRLFLSRPTVKTHVASIYAKLGVEGRSEAVEVIDQVGLGSVRTVVVLDPDRD
jgi:ATP/maltotriose-dependent transcriptional regulator MalT